MTRRVQLTVYLDVECCDDKGNTSDEIQPTQAQVTDFVLAAIGYYDQSGYEADELAPKSCDNLCVRNWDSV